MVKRAVKREDLLEALGQTLDQCMERLGGRYTSRADRLALMRIVPNVCDSVENILRNQKAEELEQRITMLEEAVKRAAKG